MSHRKDYVKVSLSDQEVTRLEVLRGDEERAVSTCAGSCTSLRREQG
jgi:hypothetical protein